MQLRPYQIELINEVRGHMKAGRRSILLQCPTGGGKTAMATEMIRTASVKNRRALFICHRRELLLQSSAAFDAARIKHGFISSKYTEAPWHTTQIASVQTLLKRLDKQQAPDLIIWDEAHHIASKSWSKIYHRFPLAYHIGLSATPIRLDGKGLDDYFDILVRGPAVESLISDGFLSEYRAYAPPPKVDLSSVKTRMGDYVKSDLEVAMDKPKITGDAIEHYKRLAFGKRAVVFAVSVEHSKHIVSQFIAEGIPAAHVDGEMDTYERDSIIQRFKRGENIVLSNVELFGEGFDLPAIEVAILLRPTQSLSLYLQQVGRALRAYPGKTHATILDHVGNIKAHGLPDEDRAWSLSAETYRRVDSASAPAKPVRLCKQCFAANKSSVDRCAYCGTVFEVEAREVKEAEGTLEEIDKEALKKAARHEQGRADSIEALIALGIKRQYKNPRSWALHIYNARQAKRLMKGNT